MHDERKMIFSNVLRLFTRRRESNESMRKFMHRNIPRLNHRTACITQACCNMRSTYGNGVKGCNNVDSVGLAEEIILKHHRVDPGPES